MTLNSKFMINMGFSGMPDIPVWKVPFSLHNNKLISFSTELEQIRGFGVILQFPGTVVWP